MSQPAPWEQWIDFQTIDLLYGEGINRYGGLRSPSKDGCIEAALGAAYNAEMYSMPDVDSETVVTGICFCGYLMFYIATKHCFTDGNKRIAWTSAMWVLAIMGLTVNASDQEAIDFTLALAGGKIAAGEDVVNWIAERLVEIPD
jgi:death on curing protein